MSSFRKDSFDLHEYFNANSERMIRLSISAGNYLAGLLRKTNRDDVDMQFLQTLKKVSHAAQEFPWSIKSSSSDEFAYSWDGWGLGLPNRQVDDSLIAWVLQEGAEFVNSSVFMMDFVTRCGRFPIGPEYPQGPFATAEIYRERIIGKPYSNRDNCMLPTRRDAEIHAEVESIFRAVWYRIERENYKEYDQWAIEAIQREYQVQLLEEQADEARYLQAVKYLNKTIPDHHVDSVENKLRGLRQAINATTQKSSFDDALETLTCIHHHHFPNINPQWPKKYRYPESKCYARATIVGNDYRRSAIYANTRYLLKDFMETLVYGGLCLNVSNNGSRAATEYYGSKFHAYLRDSSRFLSDYAKNAAELFFPRIAAETAKSAFGRSPIRWVKPNAISSSNSSLASVAKEIHEALSARGSAAHDYQVVVCSTYGSQEFYAHCLNDTKDCLAVHSHMATNFFVTRFNVTEVGERAARAMEWLNNHREAVAQAFREDGRASSLDEVYDAIVNRTESLVHEERFHGVVLLRNWAFFGPAQLHMAIHSPKRGGVQLWDRVSYTYDAKWTIKQAYTISVIFLL